MVNGTPIFNASENNSTALEFYVIQTNGTKESARLSVRSDYNTAHSGTPATAHVGIAAYNQDMFASSAVYTTGNYNDKGLAYKSGLVSENDIVNCLIKYE